MIKPRGFRAASSLRVLDTISGVSDGGILVSFGDMPVSGAICIESESLKILYKVSTAAAKRHYANASLPQFNQCAHVISDAWPFYYLEDNSDDEDDDETRENEYREKSQRLKRAIYGIDPTAIDIFPSFWSEILMDIQFGLAGI
jgi:hypothetical protein